MPRLRRVDYQHLSQGKRAIITKVTGTTCYPTGQRHTYDAVCEFAALAAAADFPTHAAIMFLMGCNAGHARCTERVRELTAADPLNVHFVRGVWAARSNGLLTDDEASRNPTLAAAWALAEANPSEDFQAQLAAAQAALAEAEEAA